LSCWKANVMALAVAAEEVAEHSLALGSLPQRLSRTEKEFLSQR